MKKGERQTQKSAGGKQIEWKKVKISTRTWKPHQHIAMYIKIYNNDNDNDNNNKDAEEDTNDTNDNTNSNNNYDDADHIYMILEFIHNGTQLILVT